MKYKVEKILDGYSVCFRQWQAEHSHCKYLHGYALYFKLYFETKVLDDYNWVWDFAWLKRPENKINGKPVLEWFAYMFDHTVIVADDDPELGKFKQMAEDNIIQLRLMPTLSCERIAELILQEVGGLVAEMSTNNVVLKRVDVLEHSKNCASAEID